MSTKQSQPQLIFASVVAFLITAGWSANHFASVLVVLREHQDMSTLLVNSCLLYTSPSPRDATLSRMPSSA